MGLTQRAKDSFRQSKGNVSALTSASVRQRSKLFLSAQPKGFPLLPTPWKLAVLLVIPLKWLLTRSPVTFLQHWTRSTAFSLLEAPLLVFTVLLSRFFCWFSPISLTVPWSPPHDAPPLPMSSVPLSFPEMGHPCWGLNLRLCADDP